MLIAYVSVAVATLDRWWFRAPSRLQMLGFIAVGVIITVVIEHFATQSMDRAWGWRYADTMPTIPIFGRRTDPAAAVDTPPAAGHLVCPATDHSGRRP